MFETIGFVSAFNGGKSESLKIVYCTTISSSSSMKPIDKEIKLSSEFSHTLVLDNRIGPTNVRTRDSVRYREDECGTDFPKRSTLREEDPL